MTLEHKKEMIKSNIDLIQEKINQVLDGNHLGDISSILKRIDSTGNLPSWFNTLQNEGRLPNLDGKTVGSVIEKLLVCVLEKYVFNSEVALNVNPAKGVDIPELELGVKSPSTNYYTSEPYFSAYERLLGNEYDVIILLTNYQEAKKRTPFRLQILEIKYLNKTEIADSKLCTMAKSIRKLYGDELILKKTMRFLSYVNQSDWEANAIVKLMESVLIDGKNLVTTIHLIEKDFNKKNKKALKDGKTPIPQESLERILGIKEITPDIQAIINAADNWVILTQKDNGRYPNDNEWNRFLRSPLDGKIGMSFALQWRYNFGSLFND